MKIDWLNEWLTLIANVGVIAGFVLVAYQLSLNTEAIRLQSAQDQARMTSAAEVAFMGESTHEAFNTALRHPSELEDKQLHQVWAYLQTVTFAAQNVYVAYEEGFSSSEDWNYSKSLAAAYVSFPVGRIYWQSTKANYRPGFAKEIDEELEKISPNLLGEQFQSMLDEIRKLEPPEK